MLQTAGDPPSAHLVSRLDHVLQRLFWFLCGSLTFQLAPKVADSTTVAPSTRTTTTRRRAPPSVTTVDCDGSGGRLCAQEEND